MTTINYSLSKKTRKGTEGNQVLLRFSFKRGVVFRAQTGIFVPEEFWNEKNAQIKIPRMHTTVQKKLIQTKNELEQLKMFIEEKCTDEAEGNLTKDWLIKVIAVFHNGEQDDNVEQESFEDAFNSFIKIHTKSESEAKHFKSVLRALKRFEIYSGHGYVLDLDKISDVDLDCFEQFLKIEHTFFDENHKCIKHKEIYKAYPESRIPQERGDNGIFSIMKKFRTFYNWSVKTGRTVNNPFLKFKLRECVYGTPYFMSNDEINQLYHFDFSSRPALAIQRDIFVFQSRVGMRVGDFFELTRDNIVGGAIEYIPSKTSNKSGDTVRVPLCKQALQILEKYKDSTTVQLLPFISQQKYNVAIKSMLKIAGINRIVTILNPTTRKVEQYPICEKASSHMARRNFIGNLYEETQDPNAIGSMTGHVEGSKAFARYRKIDDNVKKHLISAFD